MKNLNNLTVKEKTKLNLIIFFIIGLLFLTNAFAQGPVCDQAQVLCTPNAAFPASTSSANLGALPQCGTAGQAPGFPVSPTLFSTPNPAFYTLQVVESGDIYLFVDTFPQEDVDFAIWGPFSSPDIVANCSGGDFPPGVPIDCDYSVDTSEQIDVPGAIAGESYILMISNFSGDPTDITLSPNNSHGTNTAVLGGPLGFEASAAGPYALTDAPTDLQITPPASDPNVSGISFSGPGITDSTNGTFSPTLAGVGTHTVTVTGTSYLCPITRDLEITVFNPDTDGDGVLNGVDVCEGFDDNEDFDSDGVPDGCDQDDDNDGILDSDEDSSCNPSEKIEVQEIFNQDFGFGTNREMDPFLVNHVYRDTGAIPDGFYAVVNSASTGLAAYSQTNANGNVDGSGDTNGRYLAINIDSSLPIPAEIYRNNSLQTIPGQEYLFKIDLAGLCDGCTDLPILTLQVEDSGSALLASANSSALGILNDDVWRNVELRFTATTSTTNIVILNSQPNGNSGNDIGIDNIILSLLGCDTSADGNPNSKNNDSDNDGCPDALEGDGDFNLSNIDGNGQLTSAVDPITGIPSAAGSGQNDLSSIDDTVTSGNCDDDGDGIVNAVDSCEGFDDNLDNDSDGVPDGCDLDDDNDGILDSDECIVNDFQWIESYTTTADPTVVTGTVNGVGVTYASSENIALTGDVYGHATFPIEYNVPNTNPAIRNTQVSTNTITFSQPVTDPTFVFSSIGQPSISVPIVFSNPITIVWSQAVVQDSPTQITGTEGYAIVKMLGTFSEVSFDYTAAENWTNFVFGADFFTYCNSDTDSIPDYQDNDSDNDGCFDALEGDNATLTLASVDTNGQLTGGVDPITGIPTVAGTGQVDVSSTDDTVTGGECDDDDDGVPNATDICEGFDDSIDFDSDGVPDGCDQDDDNDGILDVDESCATTIINNSFDIAPFGNNLTSINGWTVFQGNVDVGPYNPTEGSNALDLNGVTTGGILQDIPTISGRTYKLLFDYAANTSPARSMNVIITDMGTAAELTSQVFTKDGENPSAANYVLGEIDFVATGTTTTITFESLVSGNGGNYWIIFVCLIFHVTKI